MKVCFVENTSVINREHHLPLGSLTCEQLNSRGWDEYRLLGAQLDFLELNEETKVSDLVAAIDNIQKSVDQMKAFLVSNRYYQMNDEAANTFAWVETMLDGIRQQVKEKMSLALASKLTLLLWGRCLSMSMRCTRHMQKQSNFFPNWWIR